MAAESDVVARGLQSSFVVFPAVVFAATVAVSRSFVKRYRVDRAQSPESNTEQTPESYTGGIAQT